MKNSTWRKIGYLLAYVLGIGIGIIIGQAILLNWVGNLAVRLFQLSPEQAADFYQSFYSAVRNFIKS